MHTIITGVRGVGKSTLIKRILKQLECPIYGFETVKESSIYIPHMGYPVYIYEADGEHKRSKENLVGFVDECQHAVYTDVFEKFVPILRRIKNRSGIIMMDEIGTMEQEATTFCEIVLELFNGEIPIIAAVKDKDNEFLNSVRNHSNVKCFRITNSNREEIYQDVLKFVRAQLKEK